MKTIRVSLLILLLMILCVGNVFAADSQQDSKKADWHYVITKSSVSYSIDMNSVRFPPKTMILFDAVFESNKTDEILFVSVIVNASTREYRLEEGYSADGNGTIKNHYSTPSDWINISKDSPIEHIVDYIFRHHPLTKANFQNNN